MLGCHSRHFRAIVLLSTLLLVAAIASEAGASSVLLSASDYTNHVAFEENCLGYERLEEYLQDQVNSETDLEANMQAAERLAAREMQKPIDERDLELLEALRQFESLKNMDTCDHESYEILTGLKRATRYPIDRLGTSKKRGPLRRIELIMSQYALEHALKCKSIYPNKFNASYAHLTSTLLNQIDALMETVIDARLSASGVASRAKSSGSVLRRVYASFMDKNDSFKNAQDAALILGFLNKSGLLTGHVKDDVQRHIIEPCNYYTQHLGSDIFIPAQLDSGVLDRSNKYKPGMDEQRDGFIYGWARYGFCAMLQRDQNHLIKKMIALIPSN